MGKRIRADGDTWEAAYDDEPYGYEAAAVVFHCVSNPQRPYRVVQVSADVDPRQFESDGAEARLRDLFERSQVMDWTRDPEADPKNTTPRTTP